MQLPYPAYDCVHLARERDAPFVTADATLIAKVRQTPAIDISVLSLEEAAAATS